MCKDVNQLFTEAKGYSIMCNKKSSSKTIKDL